MAEQQITPIVDIRCGADGRWRWSVGIWEWAAGAKGTAGSWLFEHGREENEGQAKASAELALRLGAT